MLNPGAVNVRRDLQPQPVGRQAAARERRAARRVGEAVERAGERRAVLGGVEGEAESFASTFGPGFYGLPVNDDTVTLVREEWRVPESLAFGADETFNSKTCDAPAGRSKRSVCMRSPS